jgi:hypothetical protein
MCVTRDHLADFLSVLMGGKVFPQLGTGRRMLFLQTNNAASRIELVFLISKVQFSYADNIEYVDWKSKGERCNPSGLLCLWA